MLNLQNETCTVHLWSLRQEEQSGAIIVELDCYYWPGLVTAWNPFAGPPPVSPLNPSHIKARVIF